MAANESEIYNDCTLVDLPCGCTDVYYPNGIVDREHNYVVCDGLPIDLES